MAARVQSHGTQVRSTRIRATGRDENHLPVCPWCGPPQAMKTPNAREHFSGLSGACGTTCARARIGNCHSPPVSAKPARKELGTPVQARAGTSTSYVDLTCFRNGAYRVSRVPGLQVNGPAKRSPEVAVMATFSHGLTAKWGGAETTQSLVSYRFTTSDPQRADCHFG
jgi:hypothetical protein